MTKFISSEIRSYLVAVSALSTFSLAIQIVVLALLMYRAYLMRRRRDTMRHGLVLVAAVVLNLLSVAFFMVPSYFGNGRFASASDQMIWLLPVHHFIGLIAIIMTLVVVLPWLLRGRSPRACPGGTGYRRVLMRATFGLFFLSIVLGFAVYLYSI